MCRTYNNVGSLTTIKSYLEKRNINDFKSLKEVIDFQKTYTVSKQQLIAHHKTIIEQEKILLNADLQQLDIAIEAQRQQSKQALTNDIDLLKQELHILTNLHSTNLFQKLNKHLKCWHYNRKIHRIEQRLDSEVEKSISTLLENYQSKNERYQFITLHLDEAVQLSLQAPLLELERKKTAIDELNNFIYGAIGEQKVVKTLRTLSDEYFLINDFSVSFSPAIHNRNENDFIKSIQVDHILVGPSGIFIIETKNWNEKSLENLSLRSPVQQIKRTSFALFRLINNEISNHRLSLDKHHWGDKKTPIRNLIVLTNTKPKEEFQFVKVLTVNELIGYVNYFKPVFSINETKKIADFLLLINEQKVIKTK